MRKFIPLKSFMQALLSPQPVPSGTGWGPRRRGWVAVCFLIARAMKSISEDAAYKRIQPNPHDILWRLFPETAPFVRNEGYRKVAKCRPHCPNNRAPAEFLRNSVGF